MVIKGLTSQDLDDIKKKVEDEDPNVKIDWITSEDEKREKESGVFSYHHIHTEELIHFDSGHSYKIPESLSLDNKWHYGVIFIKNLHQKITLQNAKMDFIYEWSFWQMNPVGMNFEAPPKKKKATEYTIKRKKSFITKFFTSKEAFEHFHYKHEAIQEFGKEKEDKHIVKRETFNLGDLRPNAERYVIFKALGWSNRVTVHGEVAAPKKEKK